uniref:Uncharacterized protein n=1 Tax=Oryza meridionalis TaxID=40149 RepID=A0A0E0D3S7_9ORYZ
MPVYMATQRRSSSSYSYVSTRNIHRERDLDLDGSSKKLAVTTKRKVIAKKRSSQWRSSPIPAALEKIMMGTTVSLRIRVRKLLGGR